jgi:hypothetical protein
MPCVRIPNGIMCLGGPTYDFAGYVFEVHSYFGPMLLNRSTHEVRKHVPEGFWAAWDRFEKLSENEKESHAVD